MSACLHCERDAVAKGICLMHYKRVQKHGDPHFDYPSNRSRSNEDRFWDKFTMLGPDICWPWQGANTKGYGVLHSEGDKTINVLAHRLSWEIFCGEIPDGLWVLHDCDNPPCVNPAHLFLGTVVDNNIDMLLKGRAVFPSLRYGKRAKGECLAGESHPMHKLTTEDVIELRRRYADGTLPKELAGDFSIHVATAWAIATRRTWRHV